MKRRFLATLLIAAAAFVVPGTSQPVQSQEAVELRIATLAPSGSRWDEVFQAWNQSVKEATNNQVSLRFYTGGSQGDERDFVRKMRAGQLDGAAITSTGLGLIVRQLLVLGVPGVFTEYRQIDRARRRLARRFERKFEQAGYKLLGWGDVGKARLFSTREITRPADLRQARPWAWTDDVLWSEFLSVAGANPVRLGVPEVYPALQTRMVDTVPASALAAVSLQWYTRLRYVSSSNSGILIGATILKGDKFDALSDEHKTALTETATRAHRALARAVRRDDNRAYRTITRRGLSELDFEPHAAEWAEAATETRNRLAGRVYPRSLLERVEAAAAQ